MNQDHVNVEQDTQDKKKRHQKYANKALLEKGKKIKEANSPKIQHRNHQLKCAITRLTDKISFIEAQKILESLIETKKFLIRGNKNQNAELCLQDVLYRNFILKDEKEYIKELLQGPKN